VPGVDASALRSAFNTIRWVLPPTRLQWDGVGKSPGTGAPAYPECVPIYDFECHACGERFEALVAVGQLPACPACATSEPQRLFSPIAGPLKTGLRGSAARRSDSLRHSRDERLREGLASKRESRKQTG
jgi:putative FmdB family regulatory protein